MKKIFISQKCKEHSARGTFVKRNGELRMKSGGHGQENITFLKQKNMPYTVTQEYNNGVRRGNVSSHIDSGHRNKEKQCWFPESWQRKDIEKAGQHVLSLKKNQVRHDGTPSTGTYKNVKVGLYTKKGFVQTIFP